MSDSQAPDDSSPRRSCGDGHGNRGLSRRSMLAATAGVTVSTSGCIRQVRSIVNRDEIEQLSLTITTLPADGDRESIQLAQAVGSALETVGIDVSIDMRSHEEFLRTVLVNHDFDIYVGRHPGDVDPDFLYETLHSTYADEAGWQNPFGFTNLTVDDHLERQRAAEGDDRDAAVTDTLEALALEQPFVPVCVPDEFRLARTDRFDGWDEGHLATRLGYLGLESQTDDASEELRTVHTDARPSQNLNPLSVEYRNRGTFTDLLYDPLAVPVIRGDGEDDRTDEGGGDGVGNNDGDEHGNSTNSSSQGELEPWLAADWEWDDDADGTDEDESGAGTRTVTVDLREDCQFHDGEPLTAGDVAFTYRFLADTAPDESEFPAPSPRYRGRVAAVDTVDAEDGNDSRVEFTFRTSEAVAERALTVPILPEHIWDDRAESADVPGVRVASGTTEAVVTDNVPPVGSGPYQFVDRTEREHVTFERFDDHFTLAAGDLPEPTVEELRVEIDPRSTSAIELVETGSADVTSSTLESYVVDDVLETEDDGGTPDVRVLESPSWAFYHLGFNARKAPFTNPRFRRVVAQLIDKEWLVEDVFHGHARPVATPVTDEWIPESLEWDGTDPETPFLGSDGEIDVDAARAAFEDAGLRYDDDGRLRVRY